MPATAERPAKPAKPGQAILATLAKRRGCVEAPIGSNNGPCVREAQRFTYLRVPSPGQQGWEWCVAEWQRAVAVTFGHPYPERTASVYILDRHARNLGLTIPLAQARPGDAALFHGGTHITTFVTIDRDAGTFVGRGGNQAHRVMDTDYSLSRVATVISAARVADLLKWQPPPTQPRKLWEVVRGEDARAHVVWIGGNRDRAIAILRRQLERGRRVVTVRRRRRP